MSEWLQVKNLEMLVSKSELNLDINKNNAQHIVIYPQFIINSCG